MTRYCKIGKAVLTKAVGLQKNYVEVIDSSREVLDIEATGCEQCRCYYDKQVSVPGDEMYASCEATCASCPLKKMKTENVYKRVYHNEANQFGYQPRLKTNAIKLFIAYHFLEVNSFGFVRNVNLKEIAKLLNCNIKTIRNNNDILRQYGYISFNTVDTHIINVLLMDYENYFKPASEGGRGYITMSDAIFNDMRCIDSLNVLRLTLRGLMDYESASSSCGMEKEYADLRRLLPSYCKRGVIQAAVKKVSLFVTDVRDSIVRFVIKPEYEARRLKKEQEASYRKELMDFGLDFCNEVARINSGEITATSSKYSSFFEGVEPLPTGYVKWVVTPDDASDLAQECVQFSLDSVMDALRSAYKTYRSKHIAIKNLGGLVRTTITSKNLYSTAF